MVERTSLVIDRRSIGTSELRSEPLSPLAAGSIRVRIDHVAITANTVTYAQLGEMLGYWGFFPVDDPRWGRVPAIGWGTVLASNVAGIDAGAHVHGWFPMATTVDLRAAPSREGFTDVGEHRAPHAPIYRSFVASDRDPLYTSAADEERHSLLRGLHATGTLIRSFLADQAPHAEQSIVMSASSKTAIGYAFDTRRAGGPRLVGVTSARHVDFVRALELYDDVITYGDVGALPLAPSVVVDVAGAGDAVARVHARLGDRIARSMIVGKSHHDAPAAKVEAGPRPSMFFAPSEVERRIAALGRDAYRSELAAGLGDFIAHSRRWLTVERHAGPAAFQAAWQRAIAGAVPPSIGVVATMHA